jgi:thiamine transport system permease protein
MARRPGPLGGPPAWPGAAAAALVAVLCLGPVLALGAAAGGGRGLGPADAAALRFTLLQAGLSAAISVGLAVPVARALARRRFPGRDLFVTLLGAPFLLPSTVAVLGIVAVWGRQGLVADGLAALGLPRPSPYGLHGVVLAHVTLNLPLATRLLLFGWLDIPAERFRTAAALGLPVGPLLERPMLRQVVPGALAAVFALCLTSFAVALILGGGPAATTVELAIFQAVRFEADLGAAAALALVQYGLCGAAALAAWAFAQGPVLGGGLGRTVERHDAAGLAARLGDAAAIGLVLLLLLPLAAALLAGIGGLVEPPPGLAGAAARSLGVALAAAALCLALAFALALRGGPFVQAAGALPLAASSLALGSGLFVLLRPWGAPSGFALPVAALLDALLALPFALRALLPALAAAEARHGRLASALGLTGWRRLPLLLGLVRAPIGFAAGLAAALSVGSLGAIALFAGPGQETLPLLMVRLMGAYRMEAAAATGLVAVLLALLLFLFFDRRPR